MSMLGLASVLFCTLVAGVRYWDGSYFDASGLESRVFWGMLFWVCHVSKPGNYMDLTQIYGETIGFWLDILRQPQTNIKPKNEVRSVARASEPCRL